MIRRFREFNLDLEFSWQWRTVRSNLRYLQYLECELVGQGKASSGYSEGWFVKRLQPRAFSEAWERWWLKHFALLSLSSTRVPQSSNGLAAHPSIHEACRRSRLELIERQDVLLSWQKPGIWKRVEPSLMLRFVQGLIEIITQSQEWVIEFYQVASPSNHVTMMGLLIHQSGGVLFDAVSTDQNINGEIYLKLAFSLLRSVPFVHPEQNERHMPQGNQARPGDHRTYYFNPDHAKAFEIHRSSGGSGKSLINDAQGIRTISLIENKLFPSLAYSFHPDWPELQWGASAYRVNGWPHPIA